MDLRSVALVAAGLLVVLWSGTARPGDERPELKFRDRGQDNSARREGVISEPVGAQFVLQSATAYRETFPKGHLPKRLKVCFYRPQKGTAHLSVQELRPAKSYQLKALRTSWPKGWSMFGPWPTGDVLAPLGLVPEQLGVVVSEKVSRGESGRVFPALLLESDTPEAIRKYRFTVLSDTRLKPLSWRLYRLKPDGGRSRVSASSVDLLAPREPQDIEIDASDLAEGDYRLSVTGDYEAAGQVRKLRKQFDFFHRAKSDLGE